MVDEVDVDSHVSDVGKNVELLHRLLRTLWYLVKIATGKWDSRGQFYVPQKCQNCCYEKRLDLGAYGDSLHSCYGRLIFVDPPLS